MALIAGQSFAFRERRTLAHLKRVLDVVFVLAALPAVVPVIGAAILAILIEDGRPVFFRQRRIGRFEREFVIWKLRTMWHASCGDASSPQSPGDARITRVGRFLRRYSIDELPQLLNLLLGDMTIVGPRPEMPAVVERYEPWQHLRHLVRPGLTGLWQVTVRSTVPLAHPDATVLDLEYIRVRSLVFDALLLGRTFVALLFPKGAF